jgi:hypothetical protein
VSPSITWHGGMVALVICFCAGFEVSSCESSHCLVSQCNVLFTVWQISTGFLFCVC